MPDDYSFDWLPVPIGLFVYMLDLWGNALLNWALPLVPWGTGVWHSVYFWGIPLLSFVLFRTAREYWSRYKLRHQKDLRDTDISP
jgi:hypothetical protein